MALEQIGPIIPGIPLAALDAVTDPNVRDVLRALVSTHHVRNNQAGSGDESFITARQALRLAASAAGATAIVPPVPAYYMRGVGDGSVYEQDGVIAAALGTTSISVAVATRLAATVIWRALPVDMPNTGFVLRVDGVDVLKASYSAQFSQTINAASGMSFIAAGAFFVSAGSHVVTLHFNNSWHSGSFTVDTWAVLLMPVG